MEEDKDWVTASQVADYTYCPATTRLQALGYQQNEEGQRRMAAGKRSHEQWQVDQDAVPATSRSWALVLVLVLIVLAALALYLGGEAR